MTIEEAEAILRESPDHRVLTRLKLSSLSTLSLPPPEPEKTIKGLFVDVETTGLDREKDEVIEIAAVPFAYGKHEDSAVIYAIGEPFVQRRQPKKKLTPEITQITGLTDEMLAGQSIDVAALTAMVAGSKIVVAHHAAFDRPFCEGVCPAFINVAWGCSMSQVPWKDFGIGGHKLEYIAMAFGHFLTAHRAEDDAVAALCLLGMKMPDGRTGLDHLHAAAWKKTHRVWAEKSAFMTKDALKDRGYEWNDGTDKRPKSWHKEVKEDELDAEIGWLRNRIYGPRVAFTATSKPVGPRDRFTIRG